MSRFKNECQHLVFFSAHSFFTTSYNTNTKEECKCGDTSYMLSMTSTKCNRSWHDSLKLLKPVLSVQQFFYLLLPPLWSPHSHPAGWHSEPFPVSQRLESEANTHFHQARTLKMRARCLRTVRTPAEGFSWSYSVPPGKNRDASPIRRQAVPITGSPITVNTWRYMTGH